MRVCVDLRKKIKQIYTVIFIKAAEITSQEKCDSVQYLNINDSGIIQCSFKDYVAVIWYNSEKDKTILLFQGGIKSGDGYSSGQYDIFPNGSLFIQHVTIEHDALFKVSKVISVEEALFIQYDIQVITMGEYKRPFIQQ